MLTNIRTIASFKRQWRRQILAHRDPFSVKARKGLVAMYVHDNANLISPYTELSNLSIFLVYEDEFYSEDRSLPDRAPLRLCGYRAKRVTHGVHWGGATNSLLYKDLTLYPGHDARGQRLDAKKEDLLRCAIELDHSLTGAAHPPTLCGEVLRLPRLWAGYHASNAAGLHGAGPEFELECGQTGLPMKTIFRESERQVDYLKLYPLDWVCRQLDLAVNVFAEMRGFPRRQVFRLERFPDDLIGYRGASAFDFYHNRYRRTPITTRRETIQSHSRGPKSRVDAGSLSRMGNCCPRSFAVFACTD